MNIAYFIYYGRYVENDMFDVCIRSLKKQSDCEIYVYTPSLNNQKLLKDRKVNVVNFPMGEWENRRMVCKVEKVCALMENLNVGDNVMVFDADLIFLKNPFEVFDKAPFDFFYTTRHYNCWSKANGGVWGLTVNDNSKRFMKFYIDNLLNPFWKPYVDFRKSHPHNSNIKNIDWWIDQDFLCVSNNLKNEINNGCLEFDVTIFDATSNYNYIIRNGYGEVVKEIEVGDKYILHLKGGTFNRWGVKDTEAKKKAEQSAYEIYFKNFLDG